MQVNPESTKSDVPVFVPRDKRYIVRALSPAQKLLQTRRRNAHRCSVCRSPEIAQVRDDARYFRCGRCRTVLTVDQHGQCRRSNRTIEQVLAGGVKQRPNRKKVAKGAQQA